MKRVVFLMILALVSCLGASAVFSQNWTPGPPPGSAMPQTGVPMPVMGPQGPMQPFDPSCCPPPPCPPPACGPMNPCMPAPCGPARRASVGGMVGWQLSDDIGGIKFSTHGSPDFNMTGQKINFKLNGVWAGISGRMELADCVSGRIEYRHLFPSTTQVDTITPLSEGPRGQRTFATTRYQWDVVDASAAINLACGVSAIGGFRWDTFYVFMSHPPVGVAAFQRRGSGRSHDQLLSAVRWRGVCSCRLRQRDPFQDYRIALDAVYHQVRDDLWARRRNRTPVPLDTRPHAGQFQMGVLYRGIRVLRQESLGHDYHRRVRSDQQCHRSCRRDHEFHSEYPGARDRAKSSMLT